MAIEKAPNKMMNKEDAKTKEVGAIQTFFFSEYGVSIQAVTREEAEAKLKDIINKK